MNKWDEIVCAVVLWPTECLLTEICHFLILLIVSDDYFNMMRGSVPKETAGPCRLGSETRKYGIKTFE